ncbi:tRNA (adenosine(37)-N6)-threonylcarbamoyltransferase complex dimerization subunit type 1 TsaB [soil metagenome]
MALLLNIDTATEYAGICISKGTQVLGVEESMDQKNHGAFVQPAIQNLLLKLNININAIDGIVVSAGPGSYTGLRVGLSTAKGLCYTLQKPLIMVNTLKVMAYAAMLETRGKKHENGDLLFCPMIDARRMEVFTALFNDRLDYIIAPTALVLTEISADFFPKDRSIVLSGNGSIKLQAINTLEQAIYINGTHGAQHLAYLGLKAFEKQQFADLAYCEPFYVKEFFSPQPAMKN